jgi:hypothetical protein
MTQGDWGPREALRHLLKKIEPHLGKSRDAQVQRTITSVLVSGGDEKDDEALLDRITILADYFQVPERYFWERDIVSVADQDALDLVAMRIVTDRYRAGFRRTRGRGEPPAPIPPQWWEPPGQLTVRSRMNQPGPRAQILAWFRTERRLIETMDQVRDRMESQQRAMGAHRKSGRHEAG